MSEQKMIVFSLNDALYGVPIECVIRILPDQLISSVHNPSAEIPGSIELRGATTPVVDLRACLQLESSSVCSDFIVLKTSVGNCAVKVDSVDRIETIELNKTEMSCLTPQEIVSMSRLDQFVKSEFATPARVAA